MSDIEWTDETWNPTTGCDRISPGCDHCYALTMAGRLKRMGQAKYQRDGDARTSGPGFALTVHPDTLDQPLRWRKPRTVFVDSMSDLFHVGVGEEFITHVFATMSIAPQHTFQVLTKRPQRMAAWANDTFGMDTQADWIAAGATFLTRSWGWDRPVIFDPRAEGYHAQTDPNYERRLWPGWPLPNVWLGTSIESDRYTFRADHLRATPAAVRFLSCEPLLGPVPSLDLTGIDWVIVGGESGPGARPMQPDWVRDIRDRCEEAHVPFFFKQWGAWLPYEPDPQPPFWAGQDGDLIDGHHLPAALSEGDPVTGWWAPDLEHDAIFRKAGKKIAGRELDGRTWDQMPAVAR